MITRPAEQRDTVTSRFAGDSGDGMQLTGNRFTSVRALLGNDVAQQPDLSAEIRALAGPDREVIAIVKANAYGHGAVAGGRTTGAARAGRLGRRARGCGVSPVKTYALREAAMRGPLSGDH